LRFMLKAFSEAWSAARRRAVVPRYHRHRVYEHRSAYRHHRHHRHYY
jgi:hypothetical protein